ncbi:MAG TPA: helix-turn-helix domain-containing protein [Baekduia sp.]|uniref:TetR/AcrR family transcriptional regulator n=1 Tax=Baekduia sp. TaxID=2600305 RepID=UPI002D770B28|nr:helix-turn-helix domain-containing protein [Baekduia sp.]HET6505517.1 helix-turn-helix domain-containing protein [Baekduia sp.]
MASTEPQKPLRADARRNRERIVDAARALFAECGAGTQMDDVARRAQVGVGTVYRHFPTKQALLGELLAAKFRGHAEIARRWADEPDGWTAFEGFLRETFAQIAQDATLQQRVHWVDDDEALAIAAAERDVVVEILGGMIDRAQAQGRMRATFTVADIPALMCAVGAVYSARNRSELRADAFVELLIDGLRAPA